VDTVDLAGKAGSLKAANIVALAAFVARSRIVDLEVLRHCVKEEFAGKPKVIPVNMAAFQAGVEAAKV